MTESSALHLCRGTRLDREVPVSPPKSELLGTLLCEIRSLKRRMSWSVSTSESSMPFLGRSEHSDSTDSTGCDSSDADSPSSDVSLLSKDQDDVDQRVPFGPPLLVTIKDPGLLTAQEFSFASLRLSYLLVTLVVMLADGMQGTHLYVLYESYGYSVASLYCLGFLTGGLMSPVTGPLVDMMGRKKAAIMYCLLEIFINGLEQYPYLPGLIVSRMIGGFTTNLLCQVFETWLDTEYRRRGLAKEKYEIIMRDSVIVSNLAAIFSGYVAHVLAEAYGAKGPFRGAVCCTGIALVVIATAWTENYGNEVGDGGESKNMFGYFREAVSAFRSDHRMLRVGVIQGLSAGSIQVFIFLWAPSLRDLARSASASTLGLDSHGEPAYGLIFGAFMAAGVLGGIIAPPVRRAVTRMLSPAHDDNDDTDDISMEIVEVDGEEMEVRPMAVEFLAAFCYLVSAILLLVPCLSSSSSSHSSSSFSTLLTACLILELLIGVFLPCEGVIRSLYFPATARASVMSLPRIVVNGVVSVGVVSTNFVSLNTAFTAIATMMLVSSGLQLSLISSREWSSLGARLTRAKQHTSRCMLSQCRLSSSFFSSSSSSALLFQCPSSELCCPSSSSNSKDKTD